MEHRIKMDDLGVPLFLETPMYYPLWIHVIILLKDPMGKYIGTRYRIHRFYDLCITLHFA